MGSCLAELMRKQGHEVTIVTTANSVSAWTFMNNESADIRVRMIELRIKTVFEHRLQAIHNGVATLSSIYAGQDLTSIDCKSLIVVGAKNSDDQIYQELNSNPERLVDAGITSLRSIGDCRAPGAIVHAVYSGHECARTIDAADGIAPFAWERPAL